MTELESRYRVRSRTRLLCAVVGMLTVASNAAGQERPRELDRLEAYIGTWRSDARTTADGRVFRFGYALHWFDTGHTVVEMLITQRFEDGEVRMNWRGFKGWDRVRGGLYYHGFSPSGRVADGRVVAEPDAVLTTYDGWGAEGAPVRIQDRFLPVEGGVFTSITSIWQGGTWREIMRDHWTRVDA